MNAPELSPSDLIPLSSVSNQPVVAPAAAPPKATDRLVSLDAYRGFIMLAMASGGFAFSEVYKKNASLHECPAMAFLAWQFEHVEWVGCTFWDLIQPSFMFMVGVAMAYSYAKRASVGDSWLKLLGHAVVRSFILVALGVFLSSEGSGLTNFTFVNVLTQIGLGYTFLFLLWNKPAPLQIAVAVSILLGYWMAFDRYPIPDESVYAKVGVTDEWRSTHLAGLDPHWHKNTNFAAYIDGGTPGANPADEAWPGLMNYCPRPRNKDGQVEWFRFNRGGYQTLNFIPSLATMIFGLLIGELLRSHKTPYEKLWWLVGLGVLGVGVGWVLGETICPLVKRIWTPSWAIYSTGWTCLILAFFYFALDVVKSRWWSFPLIVVGMNSIAIYVMAQLMKPWIRDNLKRHVYAYVEIWNGPFTAEFTAIYLPMLTSVLSLFVMWLICLWMYSQKIFIRI